MLTIPPQREILPRGAQLTTATPAPISRVMIVSRLPHLQPWILTSSRVVESCPQLHGLFRRSVPEQFHPWTDLPPPFQDLGFPWDQYCFRLNQPFKKMAQAPRNAVPGFTCRSRCEVAVSVSYLSASTLVPLLFLPTAYPPLASHAFTLFTPSFA